jgi:hypothetical protein
MLVVRRNNPHQIHKKARNMGVKKFIYCIDPDINFYHRNNFSDTSDSLLPNNFVAAFLSKIDNYNIICTCYTLRDCSNFVLTVALIVVSAGEAAWIIN